MSFLSRESVSSHTSTTHGCPQRPTFCVSAPYLTRLNTFPSSLWDSSWTEDTRACIFSDSALNLGRDGQEPIATELDRQIEQKFQEFDELASTGVNLLRREHHLTEMVRCILGRDPSSAA